MTLTEALCDCYVSVCVCACVCVCVSPIVHPLRKRPWVFVCEHAVYVCHRDRGCEFAVVVPSVDASAADLVCECVSKHMCVCLCEAHCV